MNVSSNKVSIAVIEQNETKLSGNCVCQFVDP